MSACNEEEVLMRNVIRIVKEGIFDEEFTKEAREQLEQVQRKIEDIEDNMYLKMRVDVIANILDIGINMTEEAQKEICDDMYILNEIDVASKNISNWLCEIENDIEDLLSMNQKKSTIKSSVDISDLLDETQLAYKMILSLIHELNSYVIDFKNKEAFFDNLTDIRMRSANCLKALLELYANTPQDRTEIADNLVDLKAVVNEDYKVSEMEFTSICSDWNRSLKDLFEYLKTFFKELSEQTGRNEINELDDFEPNILMKKINERVDHLIKCKYNNCIFNYENEIIFLQEAISKVEPVSEMNPDLLDEMNDLADKMMVLRDLIKDKSMDGTSNSFGVFNETEHISPFLQNSASLFSESMARLDVEFNQLSTNIYSKENYFVKAILSTNDVMVPNPYQDDKSRNASSIQYTKLLRYFNCLVGIMKVFVLNEHSVVLDNHRDIEMELKNIKNVMMVVTTTIPILEKLSNSFDADSLGDITPFSSDIKQEATFFLDCSIQRIIKNERNQRICELLKSQLEVLVQSIECEIEQLVLNEVWDKTQCQRLLHQASWLINIWEFYHDSAQSYTLMKQFHNLVELINSLNNKQYKYLKQTHSNKETTKEFWFEVLQDWQDRVGSHLTSNTGSEDVNSITEQWKDFRDKMYLVCEFQQIDSNIEHYQVEFELDFLDLLNSYKYEIDKSNKSFIDSILDNEESMLKILEFISTELKDLEQIQSNKLISLENSEEIQGSLQTGLHVLEYIHSLLDKVDEGCPSPSDYYESQIRKLKVALHSTKKHRLIQSNYFKKKLENLELISSEFEKIEESIEAVKALVNSDANTLLVEALMEMFKRSQRSVENIENDLSNIQSECNALKDDQSQSIIKSVEQVQTKIRKLNGELNQVKAKFNDFEDLVTGIIEQQNQTCSIRNNLQIFLTKIEAYFTNIDIDSIKTKESAENYMLHIDKIINESDNFCKMLCEIEVINYRIMNKYSDPLSLKAVFDNELRYLTESYKSIDPLKQTRKKVFEKFNILSEADKKYKWHTSEIEALKQLMIAEEEKSSVKLSQEIETLRFRIDNSILYLHNTFQILNKNTLDMLTKDFEQLDVLLDAYESLINQRKKIQNQQKEIINFFTSRNAIYCQNLEEYKISYEEVAEQCRNDITNNSLIFQIEALLPGIISIKNEILREATNVYVNHLQDSDVCTLLQKTFNLTNNMIKSFSTLITNIFLSKYLLSCHFEDFFLEMSENWKKTLLKFLDNSCDLEHYDKLNRIETMKVILECFEFAAEQCDSMALSIHSISKLNLIKKRCSDLNLLIDKILQSGLKFNSKIASFYLLDCSLSRCAEKMDIHLLLVQSLSKDCSMEKHILLKQQSTFYKAYVKHHKRQYQCFENLCESILEEGLLGFDIEDEMQGSLHNIRKEIDSVSSKHSSALDDLDTSSFEWEKMWQSDDISERFMELLDATLLPLSDMAKSDKIKNQMYIEKLKLIVAYLEDIEPHWSASKMRAGSSSNQEYLEQKIRIAHCCFDMCHIIINYGTEHIDRLLFQYQGIFSEIKLIKLDVLNAINDLHCTYLEKDLQPSEKQGILFKLSDTFSESRTTISVWQERLQAFYPEMISFYCLKIDEKSLNFFKWFKLCSGQINKILENNDQYALLYNTIQIKLNVFAEYVEILEECDHFLKDVLSKCYCHKSTELKNCLKLSKIICEQMELITNQLKELEDLRHQIQQLFLGQNDDATDQQDRKIVNLKDVVELIDQSQVPIREQLLKIVGVSDGNPSGMISTFSSYDYELETVDKSISISGEVESSSPISYEEALSQTHDVLNKKNILFSTEEKAYKYTGKLMNIYNKLMSSISDQEYFLNEKWKFDSNSNYVLLDDIDNSMKYKQKDIFVYSPTSKATHPRHIDVHHWFPNTTESSCQTVNTSENFIEFLGLTSLNHQLSESSIKCPNYNTGGESSSAELSHSHPKEVILMEKENHDFSIIETKCEEMQTSHSITSNTSEYISTLSIKRDYYHEVSTEIRTNDVEINFNVERHKENENVESLTCSKYKTNKILGSDNVMIGNVSYDNSNEKSINSNKVTLETSRERYYNLLDEASDGYSISVSEMNPISDLNKKSHDVLLDSSPQNSWGNFQGLPFSESESEIRCDNLSGNNKEEKENITVIDKFKTDINLIKGNDGKYLNYEGSEISEDRNIQNIEIKTEENNFSQSSGNWDNLSLQICDKSVVDIVLESPRSLVEIITQETSKDNTKTISFENEELIKHDQFFSVVNEEDNLYFQDASILSIPTRNDQLEGLSLNENEASSREEVRNNVNIDTICADNSTEKNELEDNGKIFQTIEESRPNLEKEFEKQNSENEPIEISQKGMKDDERIKCEPENLEFLQEREYTESFNKQNIHGERSNDEAIYRGECSEMESNKDEHTRPDRKVSIEELCHEKFFENQFKQNIPEEMDFNIDDHTRPGRKLSIEDIIQEKGFENQFKEHIPEVIESNNDDHTRPGRKLSIEDICHEKGFENQFKEHIPEVIESNNDDHTRPDRKVSIEELYQEKCCENQFKQNIPEEMVSKNDDHTRPGRKLSIEDICQEERFENQFKQNIPEVMDSNKNERSRLDRKLSNEELSQNECFQNRFKQNTSIKMNLNNDDPSIRTEETEKDNNLSLQNIFLESEMDSVPITSKRFPIDEDDNWIGDFRSKIISEYVRKESANELGNESKHKTEDPNENPIKKESYLPHTFELISSDHPTFMNINTRYINPSRFHGDEKIVHDYVVKPTAENETENEVSDIPNTVIKERNYDDNNNPMKSQADATSCVHDITEPTIPIHSNRDVEFLSEKEVVELEIQMKLSEKTEDFDNEDDTHHSEKSTCSESNVDNNDVCNVYVLSEDVMASTRNANTLEHVTYLSLPISSNSDGQKTATEPELGAEKNNECLAKERNETCCMFPEGNIVILENSDVEKDQKCDDKIELSYEGHESSKVVIDSIDNFSEEYYPEKTIKFNEEVNSLESDHRKCLGSKRHFVWESTECLQRLNIEISDSENSQNQNLCDRNNQSKYKDPEHVSIRVNDESEEDINKVKCSAPSFMQNNDSTEITKELFDQSYGDPDVDLISKSNNFDNVNPSCPKSEFDGDTSVRSSNVSDERMSLNLEKGLYDNRKNANDVEKWIQSQSENSPINEYHMSKEVYSTPDQNDFTDSLLDKENHQDSLKEIRGEESQEPTTPLLFNDDSRLKNDSFEILNYKNVSQFESSQSVKNRFSPIIKGDVVSEISKSMYQPENDRSSRRHNTRKVDSASMKTEEKRTISCFKLFLFSFFLAILIMLLCTFHLSARSFCDSPMYQMLQSINPFYIKRWVPV